MLVWEMGRLHTERVASIYNMSVPYSNAPAPPTQIFEAIFEDKFFYMLYFQEVGPAEAEFEEDPRRFLRSMLYSAGGEGMANPNPLVADAPREGTRFQDILTPGARGAARLDHRGRRGRLRGGLRAERVLRAHQLLPQHGRELGAGIAAMRGADEEAVLAQVLGEHGAEFGVVAIRRTSSNLNLRLLGYDGAGANTRRKCNKWSRRRDKSLQCVTQRDGTGLRDAV